jgi:hypothetical protein
MTADDFKQMQLERSNRGILTTADREFLLGEKKLKSSQSEYNKRSDIRKRVLDGLLDLSLIYRELSEQDRTQIFHPENYNRQENRQLAEALRDTIALIYQETGVGKHDIPVDTFEMLLRHAMRNIHGPFTRIEFKVTYPKAVSIGRIVAKIEADALHELSEQELFFYVRAQKWVGKPVETGQEAGEQFLKTLNEMADADEGTGIAKVDRDDLEESV